MEKKIKKIGIKKVFEKGRMIVGNEGIIVKEVILVKEGDEKNLVIVEEEMKDIIRKKI